MLGAEYPKALFRDGGTELIWGAAVRTLIVRDAEEEQAALADGWRFHPIPDPAAPQDETPIKRGPGRPRKVNGDGTS